MMIEVFSRSPISHLFKILEGGEEKEYVIKGVNAHPVLGADTRTPMVNEMEESVFNKIKEKYHYLHGVFGREVPDEVKIHPQIYVAKSLTEATKKMKDAKPIIKDENIALKTVGLEKMSDK